MMMLVMMTISSPEASRPVEFMSTATRPSWKLYRNPFYDSQTHHLHPPQCRLIPQLKLSMGDSDLDLETELIALKAELEFQRKARKKAESVNRRLANELAKERRARAAVERACGELARRMAAEMDRMKTEMEEERKMLRMAQVMREKRVQMKLADAKILLEQKLSQLEQKEQSRELEPAPNSKPTSRLDPSHSEEFKFQGREDEKDNGVVDSREVGRSVYSPAAIGRGAWPEQERNVDLNLASQVDSNLGGKCKLARANEENEIDAFDSGEVRRSVAVSMAMIQRGASPEKENPHIKRGIKGFVEFPRVVRSTGSRSSHCHWRTKLESQTAQLKILLKQKASIRSHFDLKKSW